MKYYGDEDKPSLESLTHHGVKGQKWGVRKAPVTSVRNEDVQRYGKGGAVRIARRRDSGLTLQKAQRREKELAATKAGLAISAYLVGAILAEHGGHYMTSISERAETNRKRSKITGIAAEAAKVSYAKKGRVSGAYKVSSL